MLWLSQIVGLAFKVNPLYDQFTTIHSKNSNKYMAALLKVINLKQELNQYRHSWPLFYICLKKGKSYHYHHVKLIEAALFSRAMQMKFSRIQKR